MQVPSKGAARPRKVAGGPARGRLPPASRAPPSLLGFALPHGQQCRAVLPRRHYLTATEPATTSRPAAAPDAADKNLKVWRLADGECVLSLYQKMFSKDSWPSVQFTAGGSSWRGWSSSCSKGMEA